MASAIPSPSRSRPAPRPCCCRASRNRRRSSTRSSAFARRVFFGLPTLYTALTKADGAAHARFLRRCGLALSAAEVLSAEVFNGWKTLTGLEIVEGLGSTEVLHIYLSNRAETKKPGAAGQRVPGYEIALKDKDGREVADGEEGILWVRGDSNTPLLLEPAGQDRRDHARGRLDLHRRPLRARCRRLPLLPRPRRRPVKVSGQWVYPLEVELCLAEHPACARMRRVRRRTAGPAHDLEGGRGDERPAPSTPATRPDCCRISSRRNCCPTNIRARSDSSTSCRRPGPARSTARRC